MLIGSDPPTIVNKYPLLPQSDPYWAHIRIDLYLESAELFIQCTCVCSLIPHMCWSNPSEWILVESSLFKLKIKIPSGILIDLNVAIENGTFYGRVNFISNGVRVPQRFVQPPQRKKNPSLNGAQGWHPNGLELLAILHFSHPELLHHVLRLKSDQIEVLPRTTI